MTLSSSIINRALTLHESYRLRAYDSVQLASALELQTHLASTGQTLIFVASDVRLLHLRLQQDSAQIIQMAIHNI